jgi:AraC-like DNA-binding protein
MDVPNYVKTNKYEKYYEIFEKMCEHYESAVDSDEIILNSLILELIHTLINDSKRLILHDHVKNNNYKAIDKTIQYIKENLLSDLSLEAVAARAGYSPIHFHNFFKASTGKTLRDYVEEQRIKKAANMLITTDCTLAEIAYECGFSSQSYFSYVFKERFKMSPKAFRKKHFYQI